jgi:hypothetical protein
MSKKTEATTAASGGGIGFFPLLFLIFLTLKLCGVITWSWWWVTAPLWGPIALIAVLFVFFIAIVLAAKCITQLAQLSK